MNDDGKLWCSEDVGDSVHVHPLKDEREHDIETVGQCWCDPEVRWNDPTTGEAYNSPLVIHNAADMRELIEQAEDIKDDAANG